MTHRKFLGRLAAALMIVPLAGAALADPLRIAIANFGEHPQLNAVADGFRAEIVASGLAEGTDVVFSVHHVNFDATLIPQMLSVIDAGNPDLVLAITTPVAQNLLNAAGNADYPLVFAAVTDPVRAGLVPSWEEGGPNMSGASDGFDIPATLQFARAVFPEAQTLGIPYNPGEANDVAMLESFHAAAEGSGLRIVSVGIDTTNEIPQRILALSREADIIYGPASNLIQPAIAAVAATANEARVPVLNTDDGAVRDGLVPLAFTVSYGQIGHNAGRVALRALAGEPMAQIAPARPAYEDHSITISRSVMAAIGAEIPASFENCDCIVD